MGAVDRQIKSALRMINNSGELISFLEPSEGEYDPITGTRTTSSISHEFTCVPSNYTAGEIDGEQIKSTDIKLLLVPQGIVPNVDWKLTFRDETLRVKSRKFVRNQGKDVLLKLQVGV